MASPSDADTLIVRRDEEILLLKCYRQLRAGQQMVLVELAQLMAEQGGEKGRRLDALPPE